MLASQIVWLDCFLANVDRTARNTNMLMWHKELWLIDHGASLYYQHSGAGWEAAATRPFTQAKDHVLLPWAGELQAADTRARNVLTADRLQQIVALLPDDWLQAADGSESPQAMRGAYLQFLTARLQSSQVFVNAANDARHLSF